MIKRETNKGKSVKDDAEDKSMEIFSQSDKTCMTKGDIFKIYFIKSTGDRVQLSRFTFQENIQKYLAGVYSDCIQIDIIHDIPCCKIETENGSDIMKGPRVLDLGNVTVITSDRPKTLAQVAKKIHVAHVHCIKHVLTSLWILL
eukprot:snap_masked-scaffold_121-processed-gene-0.5-mRNA-1 protein AED:1.00 eAED:1.00 QI:0/0/0/0/1/1/2/0/143